MSKLDEIRRLIEAATPGPWFKTTDGASSYKVCTNDWKEHNHEPGEWICSGSYDGDSGWAQAESANFRLIAASRTLMPRLLAVVKAASRLLEIAPTMEKRELRDALAALEADE